MAADAEEDEDGREEGRGAEEWGGGVRGALAMIRRVLESKMVRALLPPPSSSTHAHTAAHMPPPHPVTVAAATRFMRASEGSCEVTSEINPIVAERCN